MMWKSGLAIYTVFFLHCLLWGSVTDADGLLPNGDFEQAPQSWAVVGTVIVGENLLPQWKIGGLVEYISSGDQSHNSVQLLIPNNGHAVRLGNSGKVSQQIHGLNNGSYYAISFSVGKTCAKTVNLNVSIIPYSQLFSIKTIYDMNGWDAYAWAFKAIAETHEVVLFNPNEDYNNPNCGPLLDGVAIKQSTPPQSKTLRSEAVKDDRAVDLVANGNFEDGPHDFLNGSNGILLPPSSLGHSPLPGWTITYIKPSKYIDSAHFSVPEGRKAVELLSGRKSVLSQTVNTTPGKPYRVTFAVGDARNACNGRLTVQATAGEKIIKVPYESKGTGGFQTAELNFTAQTPITLIAFASLSNVKKSDNSGSLCGPVLDNVQVIPL